MGQGEAANHICSFVWSTI